MGTSWISRKGGILKKVVDLEKGGGAGGMNPLTNYDAASDDTMKFDYLKF